MYCLCVVGVVLVGWFVLASVGFGIGTVLVVCKTGIIGGDTINQVCMGCVFFFFFWCLCCLFCVV